MPSLPTTIADTQLGLTQAELHILRQHQQVALSAQPTPPIPTTHHLHLHAAAALPESPTAARVLRAMLQAMLEDQADSYWMRVAWPRYLPILPI